MDVRDLNVDMTWPVPAPSASLDDRRPATPAERQPRKSRFDDEASEADLPSVGDAGEHKIDRLA